MKSSTKRVFTPSTFDDEDVDSENVDPQLVSCKKTKVSNDISLTKTAPLFHVGITPAIKITTNSASSTSAPAGRSPKAKRAGILSRKKAGNKRLSGSGHSFNKPSYGRGGIPYEPTPALTAAAHVKPHVSLDDAKAPKVDHNSKVTIKTNSPTLLSRVPGHKSKAWFFDIHEDTAEEETWNRMLHSTDTLDVSSDEEAERAKDDRGKENVPPANHVPAANDEETTGLRNRRVTNLDSMVDEASRSPLAKLDAENFFGPGIDSTSVAVIPPELDDDDDVHHQKAKLVLAAEERSPPASQEKITA